jgi:hypothetical protein
MSQPEPYWSARAKADFATGMRARDTWEVNGLIVKPANTEGDVRGVPTGASEKGVDVCGRIDVHASFCRCLATLAADSKFKASEVQRGEFARNSDV